MGSIADDPIDWAHDENLNPVVENVSASAEVNERWRQINIALFEPGSVAPMIAGVEDSLRQRRDLIETGTLNPGFDWHHDYEMARFSHRFHLANMEVVRGKRTNRIQFWRDWSSEVIDTSRIISVDALKTLYLVHGAVALGALNILSEPDGKPLSVMQASKLAIVFASTGLIAAGLGQMLSLHMANRIANRVRFKLFDDVRWSTVVAIGRYLRRNRRLIVWSERLTNGSVIWIGIYLPVLLIVLLSG